MWRTKLSECCPKPFDVSARQPRQDLSILQQIALAMLWTYKTALSPLLPSACKFYPTCSAFAREAIERHGVARGSWLTAGRLLRCRPFAPGGIDPVPESIDRDKA